MGGGNAQKTAISRERNQAKLRAAQGGASQLGNNAKAMSIKCKICKQAFMCTQNEQDLMNHVEGKHKGKTYEDCFDPIYVAVPTTATVYKGRKVAYEQLGTDAKKGYPKDSGAAEFETKEAAYEHIMASVSYITDADSITYIES
ncbi:hypothetical protein GUITHDRAFT_151660 [Guillardia theta CCMP2712]|uniref:At2g23090-like zinc-binding domain-containing protein n=1 Tax=Guillardia theta (strain CCMP2712) TaxID=905079 RepID=L1JKT3_GUITC|nr:hypothetical protein GUITHDRAFT_151660 [Guillardia theta CCMP2712]EKX48695.1 hypothetical protein GUITHDRAFT_151660 [Guillardia theta CCMP2712]|eukprot:XP_005835675.1 hypothetical protein GUITHDRAFT_151660 [Guillardia theta CCMP2712]